jgi:hypothetical protein
MESVPDRDRLRFKAVFVLLKRAMVGKLLLSFIVAGSVGAATLRLPAPSCITANAASPRACHMGCCANKTCCETSTQRTQVPAPPLLKSDQGAGFAVTLEQTELVAPTSVPLPHLTAVGLRRSAAHSPPQRVLFCTFLI